jgi:GH18 family chitinase
MMSFHSLAIFTLLKDWAASYYVSHGVPPEMINIGMALYGRSFTLKDPNMNVCIRIDPLFGTSARMAEIWHNWRIFNSRDVSKWFKQ